MRYFTAADNSLLNRDQVIFAEIGATHVSS